jgi:hypothetical protein
MPDPHEESQEPRRRRRRSSPFDPPPASPPIPPVNSSPTTSIDPGAEISAGRRTRPRPQLRPLEDERPTALVTPAHVDGLEDFDVSAFDEDDSEGQAMPALLRGEHGRPEPRLPADVDLSSLHFDPGLVDPDAGESSLRTGVELFDTDDGLNADWDAWSNDIHHGQAMVGHKFAFEDMGAEDQDEELTADVEDIGDEAQLPPFDTSAEPARTRIHWRRWALPTVGLLVLVALLGRGCDSGPTRPGKAPSLAHPSTTGSSAPDTFTVGQNNSPPAALPARIRAGRICVRVARRQFATCPADGATLPPLQAMTARAQIQGGAPADGLTLTLQRNNNRGRRLLDTTRSQVKKAVKVRVDLSYINHPGRYLLIWDFAGQEDRTGFVIARAQHHKVRPHPAPKSRPSTAAPKTASSPPGRGTVPSPNSSKPSAPKTTSTPGGEFAP